MPVLCLKYLNIGLVRNNSTHSIMQRQTAGSNYKEVDTGLHLWPERDTLREVSGKIALIFF